MEFLPDDRWSTHLLWGIVNVETTLVCVVGLAAVAFGLYGDAALARARARQVKGPNRSELI
eukprot:6211081-Prymnesium_polylepis.2